MGCGCAKKTKTEFTITAPDGGVKIVYNAQEARSWARMKGGTITQREVPK